MARRYCKCGEDRLGLYTVTNQRRVGKPTAWGHAHTKREDSHRCVDCKNPVEHAWKDFWNHLKESREGNSPATTWKPVVGLDQFEHFADGAKWTIRTAESQDVIGFLYLDPMNNLGATDDLVTWKSFSTAKAAVLHLYSLYTNPNL